MKRNIVLPVRVFLFMALTCSLSYAGGHKRSGRNGAEELANLMPYGVTDLVAQYGSDSDFRLFRATTSLIAKATQHQHETYREYQRVLQGLLSPYAELHEGFRELPQGSFVMGPRAGEPNPFGNEFTSKGVIEKPFKLAVYPVTQGQYELALKLAPLVRGSESAKPVELKIEDIQKQIGTESKGWQEHRGRIESFAREQWFYPSHFIGKDLPILYLTRQEEDDYIKVLNELIARLWPKAYPHSLYSSKPLRVRKPTEVERVYATTIPGKGSKWVRVTPVGQVNEEDFAITAERRLYPGADNARGLPAQREWREGPYPVNSPVFKENDRGLKCLTREVWEVTSTPYWDPIHPAWSDGSNSVILGGHWGNDPRDCRSASRFLLRPMDRSGSIGLRLAAE